MPNIASPVIEMSYIGFHWGPAFISVWTSIVAIGL